MEETKLNKVLKYKAKEGDKRSTRTNSMGKLMQSVGIYGIAILFLLVGAILQALGVINNFLTTQNMMNILDAVELALKNEKRLGAGRVQIEPDVVKAFFSPVSRTPVYKTTNDIVAVEQQNFVKERKQIETKVEIVQPQLAVPSVTVVQE